MEEGITGACVPTLRNPPTALSFLRKIEASESRAKSEVRLNPKAVGEGETMVSWCLCLSFVAEDHL